MLKKPSSLISTRIEDIPNGYRGEPGLRQGLRQAYVAALGKELGKLALSKDPVEGQSELIRKALSNSSATKLAKDLGCLRPGIDAKSEFALALFDEQLADPVGNLAFHDDSLLELLLEAYLDVLPSTMVETSGEWLDVVPEEAINPLACMAIDWAFSRFHEILPDYLSDGGSDDYLRGKARNLLLVGNLFGKFDASDSDHLEFRRLLAAHEHEHYPLFAGKLVRKFRKEEQDFRQMKREMGAFEERRALAADASDDFSQVSSGDPRVDVVRDHALGAGANASDEVANYVEGAQGVASMSQQAARGALESARDRLAGLVTKRVKQTQQSPPRPVRWKQVAGIFAEAHTSERALVDLYQQLRKFDVDHATARSTRVFVEEKLYEPLKRSGAIFKRLEKTLGHDYFESTRPAEQVAILAYALRLSLAEREDILRPQESYLLQRAVEKLLAVPPEPEASPLTATSPKFDAVQYANRSRTAHNKLNRDAAKDSWIGTEGEGYQALLAERVQEIEEFFGDSEAMAELVMSQERREGPIQLVSLGGGHMLPTVAGFVIAGRAGLGQMPLEEAALVLGALAATYGLAAVFEQGRSQKSERVRQSSQVSLSLERFGREFEEAKAAFKAAMKKEKDDAKKFALGALAFVAVGAGLGYMNYQPDFSPFTNASLAGDSAPGNKPGNMNQLPPEGKPKYRTFRSPHYQVPFWVNAHGYVNDDGEYDWLRHDGKHTVDKHRNFTDSKSFKTAIEGEVAKGRMVVLKYRNSILSKLSLGDEEEMEYPVGSKPIELLTIGADEPGRILWSSTSGLTIDNGGSNLTAVVFEPAERPTQLVDAYPGQQDKKRSPPAREWLYEKVPHLAPLVQAARANRDTKGPKESLLETMRSLDPMVDYGLADWDARPGSDEELIAELLWTKGSGPSPGSWGATFRRFLELTGMADPQDPQPADTAGLVNDKWICNQFASFIQWVDWQSGGRSLLITGHSDTGRPGDGPDLGHQALMVQEPVKVPYRRSAMPYDFVDVTLAGSLDRDKRAAGDFDLEALLSAVLLVQVVAASIAGAVMFGSAAFGARRQLTDLVKRLTRKKQAAFDGLVAQLEGELLQMSSRAGLGVLITVQAAIEHWVDPKTDGPLGDMSEAERLQMLARTYLHEIGQPIDCPVSKARYRALVNQFDAASNARPIEPHKHGRERLLSLLISLRDAAEREYSTIARSDDTSSEDFGAAQEMLEKIIATLND